MQRREFVTVLGSAAATWPFAGRAQQTRKLSLIGYLGTSSPSLEAHVLGAFRQKLRELGHVEGQDITIEYRWSEGRDDRLPKLAAELVRMTPDVVVTTGTPAPSLPSKRPPKSRSFLRAAVIRWVPGSSPVLLARRGT